MEGGPTNGSQRNIIARQVDPLKSVMFLEFHEAISLLVPIAEPRVHQIRNPFCCAVLDRFGDQRIRRRLIPVLGQREKGHKASLNSGSMTMQLSKANQGVVEIRPNENVTVEKRRCLPTNSLQIFSIMRKPFALTDRAFIVDGPDTSNERLINRDFPDGNSLLPCSTCHISGLVIDLLCPPVVKRRYWQHGEVIPLHRVGVLRRGIG